MGWFSLLKTILQIFSYLSKYVHDKQLLSAGEEKAIKDQIKVLDDKFKQAEKARDLSIIDSQSGGLLNDDGYKRE